ncbi:helix-turn-helix domain-containing protein [Saccharopolyspora sp. MS10]|uniref:helix-turn-helix domain-containing protein n=1 Tax=Saccharopolyspora sp. MS10 TaxID=3385973 RepID=UPI0039A2A1CB
MSESAVRRVDRLDQLCPHQEVRGALLPVRDLGVQSRAEHAGRVFTAPAPATPNRWRRRKAGRQALLVLAQLRIGVTYADLATGFGIGTTTVFRYVHEAPRSGRPWLPDSTRRSSTRPRRHSSSSTERCCASTGPAWLRGGIARIAPVNTNNARSACRLTRIQPGG